MGVVVLDVHPDLIVHVGLEAVRVQRRIVERVGSGACGFVEIGSKQVERPTAKETAGVAEDGEVRSEAAAGAAVVSEASRRPVSSVAVR